jgi:two-component system, NarL family, sensor histidine kinase DegS
MESGGAIVVAPCTDASAEDEFDARLRRELARELHDGVAQSLTTMLIEFEVFRREQRGRASVQTAIDAFQQSTRQVLANLRDLLYDLRNQSVEDVSLVEDLTAILEEVSGRPGTTATLRVSPGWPRRLAGPAALHLRRIVQEALQNARIHGRASHVEVALDVLGDGELELAVSDNGVGAQPELLTQGGFGILGMKERAILIQGRLIIETRPRLGTTIRLRVPAAEVMAG